MKTQTPLKIGLNSLLERGKISKQAATPRVKIGAVQLDIVGRQKYFTFGLGDEMKQYRKRTDTERSTSTISHFGQLKCLMAVLQFLNLYYDPNEHKEADLLYIGAAVGTNIGVLAKLYPMLTFHLYDSSKFNEEVLKLPNIDLYKKNFEDDDMNRWAGIAKKKPVFLVSDIRNMNYDPTTVNSEANKKASLKNEQLVIDDLKLQAKWVKEIKPTRALLKFRLPYYFPYVTEIEFEYFKGTVYRQVWQRTTSSETRLVPDPPEDGEYATTTYNIRAYENMCFYHNMYVRQGMLFANPFAINNPGIEESDPIAETIGLTNDYDSACTTAIICDYLFRFGINSTLEGFTRLAKEIFIGAGDGMVYKYNLYGIRAGARFRYENGDLMEQPKPRGTKEDDPEQIELTVNAE